MFILDQTGRIPESQCGFRKDRGTIDRIFTARQLPEKCQKKKNVDLYMTFADLTQLVVMDSGKSWPSLAVHSDS